VSHSARVERARIVADHWRRAAIEWGSEQMDGRVTAHPLSLVLGALRGESDPAQLGIPEGHPDALLLAKVGQKGASHAPRPRDFEEQVRALGAKAAELYAIAKRLRDPYRTAFQVGHSSSGGSELGGASTQVSQSDPTGDAMESDHKERLRAACGQVGAAMSEVLGELQELIQVLSAEENRLTGKKGVLRAAGAWDFVEAAHIEKDMKGATF
jgi:hypothetical protein